MMWKKVNTFELRNGVVLEYVTPDKSYILHFNPITSVLLWVQLKHSWTVNWDALIGGQFKIINDHLTDI